jgi:hypothetical protein
MLSDHQQKQILLNCREKFGIPGNCCVTSSKQNHKTHAKNEYGQNLMIAITNYQTNINNHEWQ